MSNSEKDIWIQQEIRRLVKSSWYRSLKKEVKDSEQLKSDLYDQAEYNWESKHGRAF